MPHPATSASRSALVTGATGFVGLNLVRSLVERGWRVVALHRESSDVSFLSRLGGDGLERRVADLGDRRALLAAVPDDLDVLFHVAADTNMWSARNVAQTRTNVFGTRHVVAAARERGTRRLVHTSSIAAYGIHDEPIDERTPSNARESWINYMRTKAFAEDEVRDGIARGLDAVILNPANILGPWDLANWSTLIYLIDAGKLPGAPPGRGSFCHVNDVVDAQIAAVDRGRCGENYLLGGTDSSYLELIALVGELTGKPVPRKATPAWLLRAAARIGTWSAQARGRRPRVTPEAAALVCCDMLCRSDKAMAELGYRASPLREMVEDCRRWMVAEGRLRSR